MAKISDVIAGTKILASWGNLIRDRTVTPWLTAADRTTNGGSPVEGQVSYRIDGSKPVEVYNGTAWVELGAGRGRLGSKAVSGDLGTLAGFNEISTGGIAITSAAGRIIRVTATGSTFSTGGAPGKSVNVGINFQIGAGAPTAMIRLPSRVNVDTAQFHVIGELTITSTATYTFTIVGGAEQNPTTVAGDARMFVDDVGHT